MENKSISIKGYEIEEFQYIPDIDNLKRFFILTRNMKLIFSIGNKYSAYIVITLLNTKDIVDINYKNIIIKDLLNNNIFIYNSESQYAYYTKHFYHLIKEEHQYTNPTFKFIISEKEEIDKIYKFITSLLYLDRRDINNDTNIFELILEYDK